MLTAFSLGLDRWQIQGPGQMCPLALVTRRIWAFDVWYFYRIRAVVGQSRHTREAVASVQRLLKYAAWSNISRVESATMVTVEARQIR